MAIVSLQFVNLHAAAVGGGDCLDCAPARERFSLGNWFHPALLPLPLSSSLLLVYFRFLLCCIRLCPPVQSLSVVPSCLLRILSTRRLALPSCFSWSKACLQRCCLVGVQGWDSPGGGAYPCGFGTVAAPTYVSMAAWLPGCLRIVLR